MGDLSQKRHRRALPQLLVRSSQGDQEAMGALMPLVYDDRLARSYLLKEAPRSHPANHPSAPGSQMQAPNPHWCRGRGCLLPFLALGLHEFFPLLRDDVRPFPQVIGGEVGLAVFHLVHDELFRSIGLDVGELVAVIDRLDVEGGSFALQA
jgi:hypothetical protein